MNVMPTGRSSTVNPAGTATIGTQTRNVFRNHAPFALTKGAVVPSSISVG